MWSTWPLIPRWKCADLVSPLSSHSLLPQPHSRKEVAMCVPSLQRGKHALHCLGWLPLWFIWGSSACEILSLLPQKLMCSIIYFVVNSWTFIWNLGLNPILLSLVAHIVPALATETSFGEFSWHTTLNVVFFFFFFFSLHSFFLSPSLLSGTTKCSRLMLDISCPSPGISHFTKELGTKYACCYQRIISFKPLKVTEQRNKCYTNLRTYMSLNISTCNCL